MIARAVLVGATVGLLWPANAPAQTATADAVLGKLPEIVLSAPGQSAREILPRVLRAAGVQFGLERGPRDADSMPIDFGRPPVRSFRLNGLTLREALDLIVREDPRYEWQEVNGRIIVRVGAFRGLGALDALVERFEVNRASYAEALAALASTLTPGRQAPAPRTFGVAVRVDVGPGVVAEPAPSSRSRRISVALAGTTVVEILEAIARAHGALSWIVDYDASGVGPEHASFTFLEGPMGATVRTPEAERLALEDAKRLVLPTFWSIATALSLYGDTARVRVGMEGLHEDAPRPLGEGPLVDLTGLAADAAIGRIVALDSRYVWESAGGLFNIRPAPHAAPRPSLLDTPIESFSVSEVTAEQALEALVRSFGPVRGGGSGGGGVRGLTERERHRLMNEERARAISLTLQHTPLREALNAICRAHGALSWFSRSYSSGRDTIHHSFTLRSYNGWTVGKTVELKEQGPK